MAVFEGADPEFGEAFRAYRNYFEDLARYIQDLHGYSDRGWPRSSLVDGVHDHVLAHPGVKSLNRRKLSGAEEAALGDHLRSMRVIGRRMSAGVGRSRPLRRRGERLAPSPGVLRHLQRRLGGDDSGRAPRCRATHAAGAESHRKPCEHGAAAGAVACVLHGVPSDRIGTRGLGIQGARSTCCPFPTTKVPRQGWPCSCAPLGSASWSVGSQTCGGRTSSLARPGATSRRSRRRQPGAPWGRRLSSDVFWRIRRKANYDDADTFVLGAESEFNARGSASRSSW